MGKRKRRRFGVCIVDATIPGGMCSVGCDPAAGACPAVGYAAFCIELAAGFGCMGELDTGNDLEDGFLQVGDSLSASVDDNDIDAFYLEHTFSGTHTVLVDPDPSLDVVITMHDQNGEDLGSWDESGPGVIEELRYAVDGPIALYPDYLVVVVSVANGTSGRYQVRFIAE